MSLRTLHMVFILLVLIAADMFGAWAVYRYGQTHDTFTLIAGIFSFLVGFAVVVYVIWLMRKLDKSKIE